MPREALLARTLVELADTLVADFDVVELLTLLADRCVEVLEVGAAGLMLAGPDGELRVMASSSEAMRVLELFELQSNEGPCLDCYLSGKRVNQDLAGHQALAPVRHRGARHRLSLRPRAALAMAGHCYWRPQPVPRRARRNA